LSVTDLVADLPEREALVEALRGPHLLLAPHRGELGIHLAGGVPQQPRHGVGVASGMGGEDLRAEVPGQCTGGVTGTSGEVAEQSGGIHGPTVRPPGSRWAARPRDPNGRSDRGPLWAWGGRRFRAM